MVATKTAYSQHFIGREQHSETALSYSHGSQFIVLPHLVFVRISRGDGKYLLYAIIFFIPGLILTFMESESEFISSDSATVTDAAVSFGCYSLYWFTVFLTVCVGVLIFLHILIEAVPRNVSTVDQSPLTGIIFTIAFGGPPIFLIWSTYILLISNTLKTCTFERHQMLWYYFGLVVFIELVCLSLIAKAFGEIILTAGTRKEGQIERKTTRRIVCNIYAYSPTRSSPSLSISPL